MANIYKNFVIHDRLIPKKYKFGYNFFWYYFDLDEVQQLSDKSILFSYNRFGFFSFYDKDHFSKGEMSLKETVTNFIKSNGVSDEIKSIKVLTNFRFLGYVFNPVSYFFVTTSIGETHCIIEICNTYKEIKPYFVHAKHFDGNKFDITTNKNFYISPFSALDNTMNFQIHLPKDDMFVHIFDYTKSGELELTTHLKGKSLPFTDGRLLINALAKPFATLQIIWAIHWHALKLFLLKVPYFKKDDNKHLQRGYQLWK